MDCEGVCADFTFRDKEDSALPFYVVDLAKEQLLQLPEYGYLTPDRVILKSWHSVVWTDTSLGCGEPEKYYCKVLVPGYQIVLQIEDSLFVFHTDARGTRFVSPGKLSR